MLTTWILLHGGHAALPGLTYVVAITGGVGLALFLRYLGVLDVISGMYMAGKRRDD